MKKFWFGITALAMAGCGGGGGSVINNSAKILSSNIATSSSSTFRPATVTCAATTTNCTPTNLQGRIFAGGALLGNFSDGNLNFNMTFLAATSDIINDPSLATHPEGTLSFNLNEPTVFSGLISIPAEESFPASPNNVIPRLETMFDYIDATVELTGTNGVDGTYVIRTVFRKTATTSDVALGETLQWADKLVKLDGETTFKWCNSTDCNQSTRPASPLQHSEILNATSSVASQPGNSNYVLYSIDLVANLTVNYTEISCTTCLWQIDYDLSEAVEFTNQPSTFDSVQEIVDNFNLTLGCNFAGCNQSEKRIKATLTIGAPGSAG